MSFPRQSNRGPFVGRGARPLGFWGLGVCAALAVGCVSGEDPPSPLPEPDFTVADNYPPGPYGVSLGDVISPFGFVGYTRPGTGTGEARRASFGLADFYNAQSDEEFPTGSPFGEGNPKPRVLLINVSAVWCTPCQLEAKQVLPGQYQKLAPLGGEFLMNLSQSANVGTPASFTDLDNWIHSWKVTYPAVLDPKQQLGSLFDPNSYPANIIVDTRTMQIVLAVTGAPTESFWTQFEALLTP